jgi:hypothetical protein
MDELIDHLSEELRFQLTIHTDMTRWEATDRLETDDCENINATIRDVFAPFVRRYAYTEIVPILQYCRNSLCHIVWSAMNVPFPRDPFEHIDRVVENTINVMVKTLYETLKQKMLMANHYAHLIQRNWRRAIVDPAYLVCRNRLLYEFKKISAEINMHVYGDIFRVSSGL